VRVGGGIIEREEGGRRSESPRVAEMHDGAEEQHATHLDAFLDGVGVRGLRKEVRFFCCEALRAGGRRLDCFTICPSGGSSRSGGSSGGGGSWLRVLVFLGFGLRRLQPHARALALPLHILQHGAELRKLPLEQALLLLELVKRR
jgi:hypothetical protein